jgi:ABC-type transport system substrate-binding protein
MIEGAARIKTGSCREIAPMRGISDTQLTLVRNPRYDPKTDSTSARENNPDRFVFIAYQGGGQTRSIAQMIAQLRASALDDAFFTSTPKSLRAYAAAERRKGLLRLNPADWDVFVNFNLTKPPFDDVHVRRAFAWGLDRTAMRETLGGALAGKIASHIIPDTLLGKRLEGYDPFKTAGDRGSLAKARTEMAKSRYATKHGRCVARACKRVFYSPLVDTNFYAAGARMTPILERTAAAIGITFANHARPYDRLFTPSNEIAIAPNVDWLKDYADPSTFVDHIFGGRHIDPVQNFDFPLVGITPARARKLHVTGHVSDVPSVDADIGRCSVLTGPPRLDCYAALDRKLTAQIVPLIPLVWHNRITVLGRQVAKWGYDQASGTTAFTHVAVSQ